MGGVLVACATLTRVMRMLRRCAALPADGAARAGGGARRVRLRRVCGFG